MNGHHAILRVHTNCNGSMGLGSGLNVNTCSPLERVNLWALYCQNKTQNATTQTWPTQQPTLRPVYNRSDPSPVRVQPVRSGPVLVLTDFRQVRSSVLQVANIRSSVQAGSVRSWTDEQPYGSLLIDLPNLPILYRFMTLGVQRDQHNCISQKQSDYMTC